MNISRIQIIYLIISFSAIFAFAALFLYRFNQEEFERETTLSPENEAVLVIELQADRDDLAYMLMHVLPQSRAKAIEALRVIQTARQSPGFAGLEPLTAEAGELLAACRSKGNASVSCSLIVNHAFNEVIQAKQAAQWMDICLPKKIDGNAVRRTVINYITTSAELRTLHFSPTVTAEIAILEASACNSGTFQ